MIDPAEEVVVIEIDSDEDPDLVGINDPKPSCRKIMPEKRKNKSKKKGKRAPTPVRTYDEIIESGTYKNSDDEFDLETYFSGDIILVVQGAETSLVEILFLIFYIHMLKRFIESL